MSSDDKKGFLAAIAFIILGAVLLGTCIAFGLEPIKGDRHLEPISKKHLNSVKSSAWECYGDSNKLPTYIECQLVVAPATPTPTWCNTAWSGSEAGSIAGDDPVRVANWKANTEPSGDNTIRWDAWETDEQKEQRLSSDGEWVKCDALPRDATRMPVESVPTPASMVTPVPTVTPTPMPMND